MNEPTAAHKALTEALKRKQAELDMMTGEEFSRELGISPGLLTRLYSGEDNFGVTVLGAIEVRYPDLDEQLRAYRMERGRERLDKATNAA